MQRSRNATAAALTAAALIAATACSGEPPTVGNGEENARPQATRAEAAPTTVPTAPATKAAPAAGAAGEAAAEKTAGSRIVSVDGYLGRMYVTPVSVIITFARGERYEPPRPETSEKTAGRWLLTHGGHVVAGFTTQEEAAAERDALARALVADPTLGYSGAMYDERTEGAPVHVELPHGPWNRAADDR